MSAEREQFLADVLTCIVEDFGYNSWRQIVGGTYRYDPPAEAFASIQVIGDGHPDESAMHDVTPSIIAEAIAKLGRGEVKVNSELLGWILAGSAENDAGNIDAEAADIILQTAIFGKLVYG